MAGISEKEWQQQVVDYATICGWLAYHTFDSRRSAGGFPDLVLVRPPALIFAELKSETGSLSPEQEAWLESLRLCATVAGPVAGPLIRVEVWRPSDWSEVERILSRRG